jgi:hypothetical protein
MLRAPAGGCAVFVGVGVQLLHFATVYWITDLLASKSETYGAIGAALAILFWAHLLGRVLAPHLRS